MNKILKRDEYISEVYDPMMEQKQYEELVAVNEGIFKTLFGIAKNLFKKDWDTIKGDSSIIAAYKELDDRLTGFSIMKLSKKEVCNQIRQELVDFACDWYNLKKSHAEKDGQEIKPAKSMNFKDETLKSNLESLKSKIKTLADGDKQMEKWSNLLMDSMTTILNRTIVNELDDEKEREELEKQIEEDLKNPEKVNKMMEEWQNQQLKEIKSERDKLISSVKATSIKEDLLGDKAVQNLCGEFNQIKRARENKKNASNLFKNDQLLGFKGLFTDEDYGTSNFKTTYKIMDVFYTQLNKDMDEFKDTPGPSVQAMCISVNAFIKNCVFGGQNYGEPLKLMAKCAVMSNGVVSYNLPLNGKKGDEAGNYFTDAVAKLIAPQKPYDKDTQGENINYPKDFANNAKTLLNKIRSEAKKLKEDADKNYDEQLKKLKLDKKNEEVEE